MTIQIYMFLKRYKYVIGYLLLLSFMFYLSWYGIKIQSEHFEFEVYPIKRFFE